MRIFAPPAAVSEGVLTKAHIFQASNRIPVKPKWDNLFCFQRAGDDDKNQLENNTTKGFLKVLAESDDSLTRGFLSNCLGVSVGEATFDYDVQTKVVDISTMEAEINLVGLSYDGQDVAKEASPDPDGGRVDGIITAQTDPGLTKFVIEVKTGRDPLTPKQMGKYRESLNISDDDLCHGVQWFDIYEFFENQRHQTQMEKDRFLLQEFTDYLEIMNMVPFRGFNYDELSKPRSTEYKRSLMRGVNHRKSGDFAKALDENAEDYGLSAFKPVSNKSSTQIHMMDRDAHDDGRSFRGANHFTAGFWHSRLNLQLNLRKRILDKVTKRKSKSSDGKQPDERFIGVMKQTLPNLENVKLTSERNPLVYVRYQRNLQQPNDNQYNPSGFNIDVFTYAPSMTSDEGLDQKISNLALAVREARSADIGTKRSLVVEKQIPYTSDTIDQEEIVGYTLEFFESLLPVYEHFDR